MHPQNISILILTHNNMNSKRKCFSGLQQIAKRRDVLEIAVLDNGSKDGTAEYIKKLAENCAKIKTFFSTENLGCAGGRKKLLELAKGEIIVFLDSDVEIISDKFIDILLSCLNKPGVGIAGFHGYILNKEKMEFKELPANFEGPVDFVSGFCQMFKKDILRLGCNIDCFYNPYFAEDVDFCYQVKSKKLVVYSASKADSGIIHDWSATCKQNDGENEKKLEYLFKKFRLYPGRFNAQMKILVITPFFYENSVLGSVKYIANFCDVLSENHQVTVFTTKSKRLSYSAAGKTSWNNDFSANEEKIKKINVRRFEAGAPDFFYRVLPRFLENIFDAFFYENLGPNCKGMELALENEYKNYDVVVLSYFPFKLVYSCAKILNKNNKKYFIIPLYHHADPNHNKKFLKKALKLSSGILALNDFSKGLFAQKYGVKSFAIKGFIAAPKMPSQDDIENFKIKHGLKDKFVVLTVGRKEPAKNYEAIIRALNYIKSPDVAVLFIGEDIDKKNLNSKRVIFLNSAPDNILSLAYCSSHVLCNMSLNESFGLVFLEAWAYGLPVIGNANCLAIKSLIDDGSDGFLCKDELDLVKKIFFLKNNPAKRNDMGLAGKRRAESEFGREVYKNNLLNCFWQI